MSNMSNKCFMDWVSLLLIRSYKASDLQDIIDIRTIKPNVWLVFHEKIIMPTNQLLSQRYFSAIVIASLIASVAFFDFAIFIYLSDLLRHIFFGGTEYTWLSRLQLFGVLVGVFRLFVAVY